jgi:hypothetical protein
MGVVIEICINTPGVQLELGGLVYIYNIYIILYVVGLLSPVCSMVPTTALI